MPNPANFTTFQNSPSHDLPFGKFSQSGLEDQQKKMGAGDFILFNIAVEDGLEDGDW